MAGGLREYGARREAESELSPSLEFLPSGTRLTAVLGQEFLRVSAISALLGMMLSMPYSYHKLARSCGLHTRLTDR